ncbi:MAG: cation diffusion facilitator family transporter [Anaerolineae bacterium]|nr:cation diffusion facilitator family transporter [Anaerolineae bacterium]
MTNSINTRQQVRHVLIVTLILNLLVAFGKIGLGLATGALAITADGFHSLTDSAGNITGLVANWVAARPPDDDHPYGHRRFETMAALLIGALLLLTAWEMIQGVIDRLQITVTPQITPLTLLVLIGTLLVNIGVSQYQIGAGKRLKSEILLADAKNTRADVFITLSVIISSVIVAVTGWAWVDIVAALVVVILIGKAAWEIVSQTGQVLVDTAPYSPEHLTTLIADMPNICGIVRARSRGSRDAVHIDIDVRVAPEMTAEQSNSITYAIRKRLESQLEGIAEIEVHFVPYHPNGRDAVLTARAYADARGLSTHEVQICHDKRGTVLEMHVEVPPQQTLAQAHEQVSQLEADVTHALPDIDRVVTHIEPAQRQQSVLDDWHLMSRAIVIQSEAKVLLNTHYSGVGWHDLSARPLNHGFAMNCHATLPAQMSVEAAHNMAESAETLLRGAIPELARVTIHTEPFDHE